MSDLQKVARLNLRVTRDQKRRAEEAARIVSQERAEQVAPGALVREIAMPVIDQIIRDAEAA